MENLAKLLALEHQLKKWLSELRLEVEETEETLRNVQSRVAIRRSRSNGDYEQFVNQANYVRLRLGLAPLDECTAKYLFSKKGK